MHIARLIGAGLGGLVAGSLVIMGVEAIAHTLSPPAVLPTVTFGFALAALAATALATAIADRRPAVIVAAVLLILVGVNLFSMSHPLWFWLAAPVAVLIGALAGIALGGRLSLGRRATA